MVVVGWDGSVGGEDALELGRLLATALDDEYAAVSVVVTGASPHARAELEGGPAGRSVVAPSVAVGLNDVALDEGAAAVVVGSSHRSALGRVLFGTDAEHLARIISCPVAVATRGFARRYAARLRRVDVDYDGSPQGRRALDLAARIAQSSSGSVRVHAPGRLRSDVEGILPRLARGVVYEVDDEAAPAGTADLRILPGHARTGAHAAHAAASVLLMF
jgi:nucleotide-binding universal stress UspA family protein